jgi:hypothetical protein
VSIRHLILFKPFTLTKNYLNFFLKNSFWSIKNIRNYNVENSQTSFFSLLKNNLHLTTKRLRFAPIVVSTSFKGVQTTRNLKLIQNNNFKAFYIRIARVKQHHVNQRINVFGQNGFPHYMYAASWFLMTRSVFHQQKF